MAMTRRRVSAAMILLTSWCTALPAWGGASIREDCTDATLGALDVLPISSNLAGGDADFSMPTGCDLGATPFSDVVVCLTPTTACTVQFDCSASGGSNVRASIVEGPCATSFSTCVQGGTDVVPPNTSTATAALTAGQIYCFVCQNTIGNGDFTASVSEVSSSCGALPVELLSFATDDAADSSVD